MAAKALIATGRDMTDKFVPNFARVENGALAGRFVACFWQPIAASRDYAPASASASKL